MLFAARWALQGAKARTALQAFLEASAEGWRLAQADPRAAAAAVVEDRAELGSMSGSEVDSAAFQKEALRRCLPYVLSSPDEKIGAIDAAVWDTAADAMGITGFSPGLVPATLSLDSTLWPAPERADTDSSRRHQLVTDGLRVSDEMRAEARVRARAFEMRVGRKPSLAVVTVGPGHAMGQVRKQLFANDLRSWFNKPGQKASARVLARAHA